jgi:O-antigen/teichoic acid export membrane protein
MTRTPPPVDSEPALVAAEIEAGGSLDSGRNAGERAAKNTFVRAFGEIVGKFGSLVLFAVLARKVGNDGVGTFLFALAWGEVAMTPVGLGIDQYVLRSVAADKSRVDELFANTLYLKVARGIPIVIATLILVQFLNYSGETRAAVSILTLGLFFDTLARTPMNVFNAIERGEIVALTIIAQRFFAAAAGLAVLFAGYGVVAVAVTYSVACVLRLALSFRLQRTRIGPIARVFPPGPRRELRRKSLPFTTQDLFGLVLARADILILSALATDAVVGLYGSAYRLFDATTFITVALCGAFTAMYTYLGRDTTPTLASVFQRSQKLCMTLLLPISLSFGLLAEPICRVFYGADFADAAPSLRILAAVPVLFGVMVLSNVLVLSREHPRRMVYTVAVAATINIGLNLALIPSLEEIGAAIAMLTSMVVYVIMANFMALLEVGRIDWLSTLAAPVGASAAMAVPLLLLGGSLPLAVLVGVPVYVLAYVAIESLVEPDDLAFVVDLVKKRLPGRGRRAEAAEAT